jgi:hypothetical protein
MRAVGLFSGIGGIEEGFRRARLSAELLCEVDSLAHGILKHRFPDVPIEEDVRRLKSIPRVDVLAAGLLPARLDAGTVTARRLFHLSVRGLQQSRFGCWSLASLITSVRGPLLRFKRRCRLVPASLGPISDRKRCFVDRYLCSRADGTWHCAPCGASTGSISSVDDNGAPLRVSASKDVPRKIIVTIIATANLTTTSLIRRHERGGRSLQDGFVGGVNGFVADHVPLIAALGVLVAG